MTADDFHKFIERSRSAESASLSHQFSSYAPAVAPVAKRIVVGENITASTATYIKSSVTAKQVEDGIADFFARLEATLIQKDRETAEQLMTEANMMFNDSAPCWLQDKNAMAAIA